MDDCLKRQTASVTPAKPGGFPWVAKGVYKGRKASVPVQRVREMRSAGHGPTAIAKALGISQMSVHRALAEQG